MRVFLDANVVIRAGKPPGGPLIQKLRELAEAGLIQVVSTDHTLLEVARQQVRNDYGELRVLGHKKLATKAKESLGIEVATVPDATIREALWAKYEKETGEMFAGLGANILPVDNASASKILSDYSKGNGFFSSRNKKDQFPDAFVFDTLVAHSDNDNPLLIVSDDGDFEHAAETTDCITLTDSIAGVFEKLGLENDAPDTAEFLENHTGEASALFLSALEDLTLEADDIEDAYVEITEISQLTLNVSNTFSTASKNGTVTIMGNAKISAAAYFSHPNWENAIWDSEDKVLRPFEEVSGDKEVEFSVEFSMSILVDDEGNLSEIDRVDIRNDSLSITLYPENV